MLIVDSNVDAIRLWLDYMGHCHYIITLDTLLTINTLYSQSCFTWQRVAHTPKLSSEGNTSFVAIVSKL